MIKKFMFVVVIFFSSWGMKSQSEKRWDALKHQNHILSVFNKEAAQSIDSIDNNTKISSYIIINFKENTEISLIKDTLAKTGFIFQNDRYCKGAEEIALFITTKINLVYRYPSRDCENHKKMTALVDKVRSFSFLN